MIDYFLFFLLTENRKKSKNLVPEDGKLVTMSQVTTVYAVYPRILRIPQYYEISRETEYVKWIKLRAALNLTHSTRIQLRELKQNSKI